VALRFTLKVYRLSQVQEVLLDGTQSINRLREDVQGITQWVESGALAERLVEGGKAAAAKPKGWGKMVDTGKAEVGKERTVSGWSAVLPSAHLKIGGVIGSVARIPLKTFARRSRRGRRGSRLAEAQVGEQKNGAECTRGSGHIMPPRFASFLTEWKRRCFPSVKPGATRGITRLAAFAAVKRLSNSAELRRLVEERTRAEAC
jgi:hypothetical protein